MAARQSFLLSFHFIITAAVLLLEIYQPFPGDGPLPGEKTGAERLRRDGSVFL
jgi:hypothetical protein